MMLKLIREYYIMNNTKEIITEISFVFTDF